jgi:hypothetical protein
MFGITILKMQILNRRKIYEFNKIIRGCLFEKCEFKLKSRFHLKKYLE